jgi:hypothetical protein
MKTQNMYNAPPPLDPSSTPCCSRPPVALSSLQAVFPEAGRHGDSGAHAAYHAEWASEADLEAATTRPQAATDHPVTEWIPRQRHADLRTRLHQVGPERYVPFHPNVYELLVVVCFIEKVPGPFSLRCTGAIP